MCIEEDYYYYYYYRSAQATSAGNVSRKISLACLCILVRLNIIKLLNE